MTSRGNAGPTANCAVIVTAVVLGVALSGCQDGPSVAARHPSVVSPSASSRSSRIRPVTTPQRRGSTSPPDRHLSDLAGTTIGIDPGHNGGNFSHPDQIARRIWNGREWEQCNTTGTATDSGYREATFTFHLAEDLRADLQRAGARVVMTRHSNTGVGPCVNQRAQILNAAHVAVAVDLHADGGPATGRGFAILEPVPDGINNTVVRPALRYARDLSRALLTTGMPTSTYDGQNGLVRRDDLAGLNLTTVPTDLIECGNMRNPTDAALLASPTWQHRAAAAIERAMATFLRHS